VASACKHCRLPSLPTRAKSTPSADAFVDYSRSFSSGRVWRWLVRISRGLNLRLGITTAMSQCVWADKLPENRWPCARCRKIKIERAKCPCGTKDSGHPGQRTGDESQHFHRRHYLNRKHHDCAVRSQPARFTQTRTTAGSQHQLQNDDSRPAKLSCKLLGCSCSSDLGPLMLRVIFHSVLSYFPSFIGLYRSIL
jgi:hypothetical protein